jgi:hypothetical protein
MTSTSTIRILVGCLAFVGTGASAESLPFFAEQLVGRWESTSFVTTNCIVVTNFPIASTNLVDNWEPYWMCGRLVATNSTRQTNLIVCVYKITEEWIDPRTKKRCAHLDAEVHFTDPAGREQPFREASGRATLTDERVEFGPLYPHSFSSRLTNGFWALEKFGIFECGKAYYQIRIKAALKRVSPEAGERLCIPQAEH